MADEFGLTKNVSAPPMPTQAKPLEQRETLAPPLANVSFTGEIDRIASAPSLLGDIGANMALQAGIKQNEIIGQYQGLNPSGEVLPPITKADEAYVKSYSNQAQATLSLQLQKMMDEGKLELDQDYELSPAKIAAFQQNMAEGAKSIIELAPSTVRSNIENNFASSLEQTSFHLTEAQISQQKERARSEQLAFQSSLQNKVHEAWLNGNGAEASKLMEQLTSAVKSSASIGMITPLQAQTTLQAASLTNETSKQIATAMSLQQKNDGSYEKFLSDMATNKPKNVSWTDWEKVRAGTASYMGQVENLQQRQQGVLYSQGSEEIANGTFNDTKAAYYQSQLKPQQYNQLMAHYYNQQRKTTKGQFESQQLAANAGNAGAYAGLGKKEINGAFDIKKQDIINRAAASGNPIDEDTAEYMAQNAMARPAPKYIQKLDYNIQSGNPALMEKSIQAFEKLHAADPIKVGGISPESIAAMELYKVQKGYTGDDLTAAQNVKAIIQAKDEKITELNKLKIDEFWRKHAKSSSMTNWAVNLLDNKGAIGDVSGFTLDAKSLFDGFMGLTNADVTASTNAASLTLNNLYGQTMVNGKPEIVRNPIEKIVNLSGATGIIQENIYEQLQPQIDASNRALEQSKAQFRWELPKRMNVQEYLDTKKKLQDAKEKLPAPTAYQYGGSTERIDEVNRLQKQVDDYESGKPITIEKVFKNHRESYTIEVSPSSSMQVMADGTTVGDYFIAARDSRGVKANLMGYFGGLTGVPVYRPNKELLRQRYELVYGRPMTWDEFVKENKGAQQSMGQYFKGAL